MHVSSGSDLDEEMKALNGDHPIQQVELSDGI